MKQSVGMLFLLFCFFNTKSQIHCTIILQNKTIIEAEHIGSINICKKGLKKFTEFPFNLSISGQKDNDNIEINNFSDLKSIEIKNYKSTKQNTPCYTATFTLKYNNGHISKIENACFKCGNAAPIEIPQSIPLQIKKENGQLNQIFVEIKNIESIIFEI